MPYCDYCGKSIIVPWSVREGELLDKNGLISCGCNEEQKTKKNNNYDWNREDYYNN